MKNDFDADEMYNRSGNNSKFIFNGMSSNKFHRKREAKYSETDDERDESWMDEFNQDYLADKKKDEEREAKYQAEFDSFGSYDDDDDECRIMRNISRGNGDLDGY